MCCSVNSSSKLVFRPASVSANGNVIESLLSVWPSAYLGLNRRKRTLCHCEERHHESPQFVSKRPRATDFSWCNLGETEPTCVCVFCLFNFFNSHAPFFSARRFHVVEHVVYCTIQCLDNCSWLITILPNRFESPSANRATLMSPIYHLPVYFKLIDDLEWRTSPRGWILVSKFQKLNFNPSALAFQLWKTNCALS